MIYQMTNVSAASEDNMIVNLVTEVFQIATFPKEMLWTLVFMLTFVLVPTLVFIPCCLVPMGSAGIPTVDNPLKVRIRSKSLVDLLCHGCLFGKSVLIFIIYLDVLPVIFHLFTFTNN